MIRAQEVWLLIYNHRQYYQRDHPELVSADRAFTEVVATLVNDARLPWWAFTRKHKLPNSRLWALRWASIGQLGQTSHCVQLCGGNPEVVRAAYALIYG